MRMKHLAVGIALLSPTGLSAEDLFYKKGLTLYVIQDVETGKTDATRIDGAVGKFVADAGALIYLKGQNLFLIRNTREPKPELLDSSVTDFDFRDGLIAYVRSSYLHVRRLTEGPQIHARRLTDSLGVSEFDIAGGTIVFLKNGSTLYRVTDLDQGWVDRVVYPVTEIQVSLSK